MTAAVPLQLPLRWFWPIAWLMLSGAAIANPPAANKPARPNPLDAHAPVPPAMHESAFARYRSGGELVVQPWKESNDTVGRIGGWRGYAREATNANAPAAVAPAASVPQAMPPPSGTPHKHH